MIKKAMESSRDFPQVVGRRMGQKVTGMAEGSDDSDRWMPISKMSIQHLNPSKHRPTRRATAGEIADSDPEYRVGDNGPHGSVKTSVSCNFLTAPRECQG